MHVEKLLQEQNAKLDKFFAGLRLSELIAENSRKIDQLAELIGGQLKADAAQVARDIKDQVDRLKQAVDTNSPK